ncbi:MAG: response regulator transcription factor [Spirulina sp. SIO3F2]|nr:response regulator transcription factor [Spirulina sp. SIO3F2]
MRPEPTPLLTHEPITVVLVDDEPQFRAGLRSLLGFYPLPDNQAIRVVGEAGNLTQALDLIETLNPHLVVLDLELPEGSGIELLIRLREKDYTGQVLVLSAHEEAQWVFTAMQAGAKGYVFKETAGTHLATAIQAVLAEQVYLSPEVATCFFERFQFLNQNTLQLVRDLDLTDREQEVLHWLVQGESNSAIAAHLYVTVATVKAHLTSIFEKLAVSNRTQAIVKALRLGLVQK